MEELLPITACPFCGHVFSDDDRRIIQERLNEKNENDEWCIDLFRIVCTKCNAGINLLRQTDYISLES